MYDTIFIRPIKYDGLFDCSKQQLLLMVGYMQHDQQFCNNNLFLIYFRLDLFRYRYFAIKKRKNEIKDLGEYYQMTKNMKIVNYYFFSFCHGSPFFFCFYSFYTYIEIGIAMIRDDNNNSLNNATYVTSYIWNNFFSQYVMYQKICIT